MVEKSEWDVVYGRLISEGRERVGDPPTADEVEALFHGTLSDEDAARMRARLVYYPELARVMAQPPPPEEIPVLTDEERREDWAAIRSRIAPPVPIRWPHRRPRLLEYAAAAALAFLGIIIYWESRPAPSSGAVKPP